MPSGLNPDLVSRTKAFGSIHSQSLLLIDFWAFEDFGIFFEANTAYNYLEIIFIDLVTL